MYFQVKKSILAKKIKEERDANKELERRIRDLENELEEVKSQQPDLSQSLIHEENEKVLRNRIS